MNRMSIWVTGAFVGWHNYPEAPEDVGYLQFPHRHKFNWKVEIFTKVGIDRELEFHLTQLMITNYLIRSINVQSTGSCEMIAQLISTIVLDHIGHYDHTITVDEDGECGACYYVSGQST